MKFRVGDSVIVKDEFLEGWEELTGLVGVVDKTRPNTGIFDYVVYFDHTDRDSGLYGFDEHELDRF